MVTMAETNIYKRENLNDIVVDYIKESILSGTYKAGDRILENEVAMKLNISRAPVREGIRQLEKEGIVTVIPRKGAHVTKFDIEDIKEVFDIRLLFENNIIEILINEDKLSEKDFIFLEKLVEKMVQIANSDTDNSEKSIKINLKDIDFHRYIWQKSGSKRRVNILEGIFFQLRMAMLYDTKATDDLYTTASDHYEIIESLRNKDINRCKKALKEHIITYKN